MALHNFVFAKNLQQLEAILEKNTSAIGSKDTFGFIPLHLSCSLGNVEIVELLIKYKADIHAETEGKQSTPLHIAAEYGREEVISKLLQLGAIPDIAKGDHELDTVFHIAASNGNVKILDELLQENPSCLNSINRYQQTPLFYAAGKGKLEAVEYLLKKGAKKEVRDAAGLFPFHVSAKEGNPQVMALLRIHDEKSKNGDERTKKGFTALHDASWNERIAAIKWLLAEGGVSLEVTVRPTTIYKVGKRYKDISWDDGLDQGGFT